MSVSLWTRKRKPTRPTNTFRKKAAPSIHRRQTFERSPPSPLKSVSCHILFYNSNTVLVGYHNYGVSKGTFAALGGRGEHADKHFIYTGMREVLEELFGWNNIDEWIIELVLNQCPDYHLNIKHTFRNKVNYISYFDYNTLENIISTLSTHEAESIYYNTFPKTIRQLIRDRKQISGMEIGELMLLSRDDFDRRNVNDWVKKDIEELNNYS